MIRPMYIHTFIFGFILSTAAFAAEEKKPDVVYGNVAGDSTLGKLLSVPGVEAIYKDCDSRYQTKSDVPKCIWDEVSKNPGLKKQVEAKYQEIASGKSATNTSGRAPASTTNIKESNKESLTTRQMTIATDYNSDPGVRALSDFFGSKLAEVFQTSDEDLKKNKIVVAEHDKFISLYKTELGKAIVNSLTGFCLNTKADKTCEEKGICEYGEKYREDNIKSLQNGSFELGGSAHIRWSKCIGGIPKLCYENNDSKYDESKKQACLVMDFIKAARKNIMLAENQTKFYESLKSDGPSVKIENFKPLDAEKSKNDSLVQITSSDLEKEVVGIDGKKTSVKNANEGLAKEVDNCIQNGQIKNEAACKKFLNTNTDEQNKSNAEFGLTKYVEQDRLEEKLKDDKNVAAYLKEEGYTEDQISAMTKDKNTLDQVRADIKNRFAAEKAAIIKEMSSKIEKKTTGKNDDFNSSKGKLDDIKKGFSNRTKDLGDLIKFTNIVSAYLEVVDEKANDNKKDDKKAQRNTASLFAEVNSLKGDEAKALKEKVQKAQLEDNKSNPRLSTGQINCSILTYKNQPECKK